jgi:hypothetical protein
LKLCKKNNQQTEQVLKALNEIIRENKTKLKTEKVELGLVDDYKKLREQGGNAYIKYVDSMDASKGFLSIAIKDAEKSVKILSKAVPMLREYKNKQKN